MILETLLSLAVAKTDTVVAEEVKKTETEQTAEAPKA